MTDRLLDYLFLVLSITTTVLLPVLLTYLWQRLGAVRDERVRDTALMLARMAQQAIPAPGDERYAYVSGRLKKRFPALNETATREAIEAAVYTIKASGTPVELATREVFIAPRPYVYADTEPKDEDE